MVTFVVGPKGRKLENTQKSVLCVRSEYFDTMFRSEVQCPDEVHVQETSFEAFESVIIYLLTDQVCVDTTTQHAFDTMDLARRYQIKRLELLCQQQVEEGLDEHNAVPLMEASNALSHDRLASRCRNYVQGNPSAVLAADGVAQLQSLKLAKGLLLDAMATVASHKSRQT